MQLYRNSIMKNHSCLHAVFVLALAMLFFACTSPFGGWGALKLLFCQKNYRSEILLMKAMVMLIFMN